MSCTVTSSTGIVANSPIAPSITTWRRDGRWAGRRGAAGASIRQTVDDRPARTPLARSGIGHDGMMSDGGDGVITSLPAHRPSLRNDSIVAAIRQFARKGFVDAAISDVAEEADVV